MKSFIYVDEYKLKSISSQIFEGLPEYILTKNNKDKSIESKSVSGIGKGRIIADILNEQSSIEEKRYLMDFGYEILEKELYSKNVVLDIDHTNVKNNIQKIKDFNFINLKGKLIINDAKIMSNLIDNFNEIGEALGYLQYKDEIEKAEELENEIGKIKNRDRKAQQRMKWTKNSKKEILKQLGLSLDLEFLKSLKYVIDFGYMDQFELQIPLYHDDNYSLFSAILNRNYLREKEQNLIQKYSRETEKEFNIFGLVSQCERNQNDLKPSELFKRKIENDIKINNKELGMKQAIMNITSAISNIENTFSGKLDYEYVIDPIAVYRKLD